MSKIVRNRAPHWNTFLKRFCFVLLQSLWIINDHIKCTVKTIYTQCNKIGWILLMWTVSLVGNSHITKQKQQWYYSCLPIEIKTLLANKDGMMRQKIEYIPFCCCCCWWWDSEHDYSTPQDKRWSKRINVCITICKCEGKCLLECKILLVINDVRHINRNKNENRNSSLWHENIFYNQYTCSCCKRFKRNYIRTRS